MTKQLGVLLRRKQWNKKNLSESQDIWSIYWIVIMGQFIDTSGVYWQSWVKTFDFPFALGDEHPAAVVWGDMFREAKIDANLFLFVWSSKFETWMPYDAVKMGFLGNNILYIYIYIYLYLYLYLCIHMYIYIYIYGMPLESTGCRVLIIYTC